MAEIMGKPTMVGFPRGALLRRCPVQLCTSHTILSSANDMQRNDVLFGLVVPAALALCTRVLRL